MTDDPSKRQSDHSQHDRPVLGYLPLDQDREFQRSDSLLAIVGGILSAMIVAGTIFVFLAWDIQLGPIAPIGAAIAALAPLGLIAWYRHRKFGSWRFAVGLLIGIGVAGLLEGLCYVSILRH